MKRLFICTPAHATQGGVERILEALAQGLPQRGYDVLFGLAKGARFHDPSRFRAALPSIRGVDIDGSSGTGYGRRRALRRAIVDADPDVVLIARMYDAYPVCAALKAEGHRMRLTVTIQAYEREYFPDLRAYAEWLDFCVTSGNLIANAVAHFTSLPRERIRSIPGGVAAPRRFVAHDDTRPVRIGYAGRLEEMQKRALDLATTAEELCRRDVPFTLDVAGDGSAAAELHARLPDARFHGWLSHEELYASIYPELDVLVHFAEWEGITIAPREAMAHGVVPVVSRFLGSEVEGEFVDGENSLTFPVGDVHAAADAIERLHRDRPLLRRLSAAARASQSGIRSHEGAIDAWAEAFDSVLASPQRPGVSLPPVPRDRGTLERLPAPLAELVRRARRIEYAEPGGEWPHWSGMRDEALFEELARFARM
ncbi:MAG TPA: glycosyltransferase family 4 protein [Thermoanaerobaculia bacterium]|nr:glycosyltransferase family 4 protein [Thermoanaerobaculia bacterium]